MNSTEEKLEKLIESFGFAIDKLNQHSKVLKSYDESFKMFAEVIDKLESRLDKLESNQVATKQFTTNKTESVSANKVYQTPTIGIEIPGANEYLMFENQAIKAPSGYFVKPFFDGTNKLVTIEGKQYDVKKLHAKLHLIPAILNEPKKSDAEKESQIKSICNKHGFELTPALLGFT